MNQAFEALRPGAPRHTTARCAVCPIIYDGQPRKILSMHAGRGVTLFQETSSWGKDVSAEGWQLYASEDCFCSIAVPNELVGG